MKILNRKNAVLAGSKRYYTGKPCIQGHVAERFTTTGGCVECNSMRAKAFQSTARKVSNARLQGAFFYMLHLDDHAAALAYCQALDLQRGRIPWQAKIAGESARAATPEEIQAHRHTILGDAADGPANQERRELDPTMRAQLVAAGFLKNHA